MKLDQVKSILNTLKEISFKLPDGSLVPRHFHVTEVGKVTRHFIDCGGTVRKDSVINFQLWEENDYDHRLHPEKLLHIIELSEKTLDLENLDIEVEYQGATIGKYNLDFDGVSFLLTSTKTACLARENCGLPDDKQNVKLSDLKVKNNSCCSSDTSCC